MKKKTSSELSHIDEEGKASMVDITAKKITVRKAIASSKIFLNDVAYKLLKKNNTKKGHKNVKESFNYIVIFIFHI